MLQQKKSPAHLCLLSSSTEDVVDLMPFTECYVSKQHPNTTTLNGGGEEAKKREQQYEKEKQIDTKYPYHLLPVSR